MTSLAGLEQCGAQLEQHLASKEWTTVDLKKSSQRLA